MFGLSEDNRGGHFAQLGYCLHGVKYFPDLFSSVTSPLSGRNCLACWQVRKGSINASLTRIAISEPLAPSVKIPMFSKSCSERLLGVSPTLSFSMYVRALGSGRGM